MRIHDLAAGRAFRDAIPDGDDFRLRFGDGLEVLCAWASSGPEVKAYAWNVIANERDLHPQFRYVTGKIVKAIWTDGETLLMEFTDGHTLRSRFKRGPEVEGVDVCVPLEGVAFPGSAGLIN